MGHVGILCFHPYPLSHPPYTFRCFPPSSLRPSVSYSLLLACLCRRSCTPSLHRWTVVRVWFPPISFGTLSTCLFHLIPAYPFFILFRIALSGWQSFYLHVLSAVFPFQFSSRLLVPRGCFPNSLSMLCCPSFASMQVFFVAAAICPVSIFCTSSTFPSHASAYIQLSYNHVRRDTNLDPSIETQIAEDHVPSCLPLPDLLLLLGMWGHSKNSLLKFFTPRHLYWSTIVNSTSPPLHLNSPGLFLSLLSLHSPVYFDAFCVHFCKSF